MNASSNFLTCKKINDSFNSSIQPSFSTYSYTLTLEKVLFVLPFTIPFSPSPVLCLCLLFKASVVIWIHVRIRIPLLSLNQYSHPIHPQVFEMLVSIVAEENGRGKENNL